MSSHAIPVGAVKGDFTPVMAAPGTTIYTCPMHPEVRQDHPGPCPKCGMALEAVVAMRGMAANSGGTAGEESGELRGMTRWFWIGAALTAPVFLLAMSRLIPAIGRQPWVDSPVARWIQFALATPVVWCAGWPFIQRGRRSVVMWNLNMFTPIAIGLSRKTRSIIRQILWISLGMVTVLIPLTILGIAEIWSRYRCVRRLYTGGRGECAVVVGV